MKEGGGIEEKITEFEDVNSSYFWLLENNQGVKMLTRSQKNGDYIISDFEKSRNAVIK